MKKLIPVFVFVTVFVLFSCNESAVQEKDLSGKWYGTFMEQFSIEIEFELKSGELLGTLRMFEGQRQIQNDQLSKIKVKGTNIAFFIESKNTPFEGEFNSQSNQITGFFTFPDGSMQKLKIFKRETEHALTDHRKDKILEQNYEGNLLIQDVRFLVEKLKENHPDLYAHTDPKNFELIVSNVINKIPESISLYDFYPLAATITNSIKCSHTGVRLGREAQRTLEKSGNYFPAKLFFKGRSAFLISIDDGHTVIQPGTEILSINGIPINDIITQVFALIPAEGNNLTGKYFEINKRFPDYFIHLYNASEFVLGYTDRNGNPVNTSIASVNYETIHSHRHDSPDTFPVKCKIMQEREAAWITIPTFGISDINYYNRFMDSTFSQFSNGRINEVVIDLRGNHGGHPVFAAQLLSYLVRDDFVYFDTTDRVAEMAPLYTKLPPSPYRFRGQSYLLVDGGCLSSAGHLISLVKYYQTSTIIGEEPGSSFKCNDLSHKYTLPATGIELNVPTSTFRTAVKGMKENTPLVDIYVETDITSILEGKDPYLEKIEMLQQASTGMES